MDGCQTDRPQLHKGNKSTNSRDGKKIAAPNRTPNGRAKKKQSAKGID